MAFEIKVMMVMVLIETLWNVKIRGSSVPVKSGFVLIETLWNVKQFPPMTRIATATGFNRNIVECKGDNKI